MTNADLEIINKIGKHIGELDGRLARLEVIVQNHTGIKCYKPEPSSVSECKHEWSSKFDRSPETYCIKCGKACDLEPKPATTPECANYHLADGIKQGIQHKFVGGGAGYPGYCEECGMKQYGFDDPSAFVNMIPKPSVEKCDTITISRKVAEEWVDYIKRTSANKYELPLFDDIRRALSKEGGVSSNS